MVMRVIMGDSAKKAGDLYAEQAGIQDLSAEQRKKYVYYLHTRMCACTHKKNIHTHQ